MASEDLTPKGSSSQNETLDSVTKSPQDDDSGRRVQELLRSAQNASGIIRGDYSLTELRSALDVSLKRGFTRVARILFDHAREFLSNDDSARLAIWQSYEARILFKEGHKERALSVSSAAVDTLKNSSNRRALAECLHFQGQILLSYSRFDSAIEVLSASLHIYSWELNDIESHMMIRNLLALVHKRRGKWAVAEDLMERTLSISEEHGLIEHKWRVLGNLGVLNLRQGKVSKAIDSLRTVVSGATEAKLVGISTNARLTLSIYDRMCGRFIKSRRIVRHIRVLAKKNKLARTEVLCYEYQADIRHDEGFPTVALKLLNRALHLART